MPVVGLLSAASPDADKFRIDALRHGLNEVGFMEGQNFVLNTAGWRVKVSVIVSLGGTPGALAAKAATKAIPIVFQVGLDPVAVGLVRFRRGAPDAALPRLVALRREDPCFSTSSPGPFS